MAIDKAVDSALLDNALAATAEKIREKTGSTKDIAFDMEKGTGFADAVEAIQAGSGDGGTDALSLLMDDALENAVISSNKIHTYGFYKRSGLITVSGENVTQIMGGAFKQCENLTRVDFPNADIDGGTATVSIFDYCSALESLNMPKLTMNNVSVARMFEKCYALKNLVLPSLMKIPSLAFIDCTALEFLDAGNLRIIEAQGFLRCEKLATIVNRKKDAVCTLANVNAFTGTPFASDGTGGTVYVPSALIESYQTATNWSTLYAAGTCTFAAIEGSEYE